MIELRPDRYVLGIWYVELKDDVSKAPSGDWMGIAYWDEPGEWHLVHRIVRYDGSEWWDEADDAQIGHYTCKTNSPEEVENLMVRVGLSLVGDEKASVDFFEIRGNSEVFLKLLKNPVPKWLPVLRGEDES